MTPDKVGAAVRLRASGFVRTLRGNGFKVGLAESQDVLRILCASGMDRPALAKAALRALLCGCRTDWEAFDGLYTAFWSGAHVKTCLSAVNPAASLSKRPGAPGVSLSAGLPDDPSRTDAPGDADADPSGRREGASAAERIASTDFRRLADPDALAQAQALAERLAKAMRARLTRRDRPTRRGSRMDFRRTIRASLATGGTPIERAYRRPRRKPLRLVLLVDASGSMSLYTAVFLRFVRGVIGAFKQSDAFLFHTRLVRISDAFREPDPSRALDRLSLMAGGVGGGTCIGDSLGTFNRQHAARALQGRACVMILSDGYDTSAPERLAHEMAALRRRCRRIVWLNPLLGWDDYTPSARGMAAALPFIDLFAPAHTLDSLAALEPYLARL